MGPYAATASSRRLQLLEELLPPLRRRSRVLQPSKRQQEQRVRRRQQEQRVRQRQQGRQVQNLPQQGG
jgi:hypothetical protein